MDDATAQVMAHANFKMPTNVLTASGTVDRRRNPNKIVAQQHEAMKKMEAQKKIDKVNKEAEALRKKREEELNDNYIIKMFTYTGKEPKICKGC
jgi:hypothetical protein